MKTTAILLSILWGATCSFGQGTVTFANSSLTLISANGTPMPVSGTEQFIFAIFLGPSKTVTSTGQSASFYDPAFQVVGAYNTNSATTAGRINFRGDLDVGSAGGWSAGSTVDYIIRGWSTNAGAIWAEALANWNNGTPLVSMTIGSSTVADNMVLSGGTSPSIIVFGGGPFQVLGFNMISIPEPSTFALAILSGAVLFVNIRHRHRQPR